MLVGAITGLVVVTAAGFAVLTLTFPSKTLRQGSDVGLPKNMLLSDVRDVAISNPAALSVNDWRRILTPDEFYVTREAGTERRWSSPLNRIKSKEGVFKCSSCQHPLFKANTKYESGTGWPSFFDAIPGGIGRSIDHKIGYARTEIHCSRCEAHLGHVFNDGPPPTSKRYCMNGVALIYDPNEK